MFSVNSFAGFNFFKKNKTESVAEEKLSEDDKIDYVDRTDVDLNTLKSMQVKVNDSICDSCVYKIKSVLQENPAIYKVTHSDYKNFVVYFKEGKPVDSEMVYKLISGAGFKPEKKEE